jgi:uncharacterized protein
MPLRATGTEWNDTVTIMLKFAIGAAAIWFLVVLAAFLGQRRLMYFPDTRHFAPDAVGLQDVTEEILDTPDGARLIVWRAAPQASRPTLLYFHGNAGGLAARANRLARYQALGIGVTMMSYRGYSGSTGKPSEAANVADARLLYDRLRAEGIATADIVLYGESLGSGVAVQLATTVPVGAVVLDAPYTSTVDVAQRAYPFLPVRQLLLDRYESVRRIDAINAALLVLHGERDTVIPVTMGRALHAAAREPKRLLLFPSAGHSDMDDHGAVQAVARWLEETRNQRSSYRPTK